MKFNQPSYNPMTYKPGNSADRASNTMAQAGGTFGRMQPGSKTTTKGPGPTAGGAVMTGLAGLGAAGAMTAAGGTSAAAVSALGGPWGIAALAVGSYLFS